MQSQFTRQPLKALFITHDAGIYGAARSLSLLLLNLPNVEIDLVVNRSVRSSFDLAAIQRRFGPNVKNIYPFFISPDFCVAGRPTNTSLRTKLKSLLSWKDQRALRRFVQKKQYDFIHLNSLVLHNFIEPTFPYFIHVRELYDGSNPQAMEHLKEAAGVIFIDASSKKPFEAIPLKKSIILNNPFDMQALQHVAPPPLGFGLDSKTKTVFSVIGTRNADKGTDFIVRVFRRLQRSDVLLLIVGGIDRDYELKLRKLAQNDPRIIFYGEEPNIGDVYLNTDYLLRGEDQPRVGRTAYEALYSGCSIVVPGDVRSSSFYFDYDQFKERIHFYLPRNEEALLNAFDKLAGTKTTNRKFLSNTKEYAQAFLEFIQS